MNVAGTLIGFCNSFSLIKLLLELFFCRIELNLEPMHSGAVEKTNSHHEIISGQACRCAIGIITSNLPDSWNRVVETLSNPAQSLEHREKRPFA